MYVNFFFTVCDKINFLSVYVRVYAVQVLRNQEFGWVLSFRFLQ